MEQINVWLRRNNSEEFVPGAVVQMTAEYFLRARSTWGEDFQQRRSRDAVCEDEPLWRRMVSGDSDEPERRWKGCAITHAEEIEGILIVENSLQPSRKPPGGLLLYVRYLAPAPWNRPSRSGRRRFRNIEQLLTVQAVRESIRMGSPGRVAVHAPAEIRLHLEKSGFDILEDDSAPPGTTYFELRPSHAFQLISDAETCRDRAGRREWLEGAAAARWSLSK